MAASRAVKIEVVCSMFSGGKSDSGRRADLVHLRRFLDVIKQAKEKGINPGLLHGAPSIQVVNVPETRQLDLTRPGGAIYGLDAYRTNAAGEPIMNILPVFRLKARIVRVEKLKEGDGVSFDHLFIAQKPTWIATIPVGHTYRYPRDAPGKSSVLISDAIYPVIVVAAQSGLARDYWILTKLSALLHRRVVWSSGSWTALIEPVDALIQSKQRFESYRELIKGDLTFSAVVLYHRKQSGISWTDMASNATGLDLVHAVLKWDKRY